MEVGAGGRLFINHAGLPNSGGVNTANDLKEDAFEVYTLSCGSRVQLGQGRLTLGQPNDAHVGSLRIASNSLLNLRAGSQTTMNAGSVLRRAAAARWWCARARRLAPAWARLVVEEGAYVRGGPGQHRDPGGATTSSARWPTFAANPALGLGSLAYAPPAWPRSASASARSCTAIFAAPIPAGLTTGSGRR
ncbi:MAG: hypothetical protein WKG07_26065 [Hymenobacter sp.]